MVAEGVYGVRESDSKKGPIKLFCLFSSKCAQDCIRRTAACAPGRSFVRAKSTGGKTESIFRAESISSSLVRFSWDRYCVKGRDPRRHESRWYQQRLRLRYQMPCPAQRSPFSALHREASEVVPSCAA